MTDQPTPLGLADIRRISDFAASQQARVPHLERLLCLAIETIADVTEPDFPIEPTAESVELARTRVRRMAREIEALTVALEEARSQLEADDFVRDMVELATARAAAKTLGLDGTLTDALATLAHRCRD